MVSFATSESEKALLNWRCLAAHRETNRSLPGKEVWLGTTYFSSAQSCLTLCDPMNRSTSGLPVHDQLLEFTQTHAHRVGDAIQPPHSLSCPSPPAPNPSQHQGLFQWVSSSHEVAKVLEFQLQHQSFQWTPRTDLLAYLVFSEKEKELEWDCLVKDDWASAKFSFYNAVRSQCRVLSRGVPLWDLIF